MKLTEYLEKYGKIMGFLEKSFLKNIYYEDYGEQGLDLIVPEVSIDRNDHTNRKWRIDFVITTKKNKFAIETDGFNYHSPGKVSRQRWNELNEKDNELIRQKFYSLHLTRDQIIDEPQEAIFQLRRSINFDSQLCALFQNWNNDNRPTPHKVQLLALEKLKETRKEKKTRGLVALATGLGKTLLSIFDVLQTNSRRILFIVHQDYILRQAKNSFEKVMPNRIKEMGFFTGKEKFTKNSEKKEINIIFSSIQTLTLSKNLNQFQSKEFDYIVMDESHHTAAPSYTKVMEYFAPKFFLGLTATPERMDKKDVLKFYEDNLVFQMDQSEAIKQGYLSKLNYKGMSDNVDYTNISYNGFRYDVKDLNKSLMINKRDKAILKKYSELVKDKKTIGFCVSIEHADYCAKIFKEAGYKSISIHSENKDIFKDKSAIERFDHGEYQIAFVVDMLNEGIDIPDVECILMLRPTESKTILTQQLGRGLRLSPKTNKKELLVLDFIGNYKSSPQILESLGISNLSELKFDKEKEIYYYDNDGRRVEFDEEVVDIFKYLKSTSTKQVDEKLISDKWKNYGSFIKENTKIGANLFWSIGKKNNNIVVHSYILEKIYLNLSNFNTSKKLDDFIKTETKNKFPTKTMEGNRALFFSKILGFIKDTNPISFSEVFNVFLNALNKKKSNLISDIITEQLEKFIFWNDNFSLTDRHSGRRKVNEVFKIYPIFFINQIIINLNKIGFTNNQISKFELENFIFFANNHDDLNQITERIVEYRNSDQKYELEKFLKKNNRMDSRFYSTLQNINYYNFNTKNISIKNDYFEEIKKKNLEFSNLLADNKIIFFDEKNPNVYKNKILYKKGSFIDLVKL